MIIPISFLLLKILLFLPLKQRPKGWEKICLIESSCSVEIGRKAGLLSLLGQNKTRKKRIKKNDVQQYESEALLNKAFTT